MLAAATLAYVLFLFGAGEKFFRDSDSGWHIRNGESILARRVLPAADPYSFSKGGLPWCAWEWGSDVLMALAVRAGGLPALTAVFALAVGACSWMWTRLTFAAGGDFLITGALAPLMVTITSAHWLARPHVFSWLLLLGALWYAERAPASFGPRQAAAVVGASALWANLHASFLLAPLIALVYAAAHIVRPLLWPLDSRAEMSRARWFLRAALAAFAGSLLNPYGWRLHAHVVSFLLDDRLTSRIAEFQSFNFHADGAAQAALAMCLAAAGGVAALSQKKLAHFLLAAMFLLGALRSARMVPIAALAILPLANSAFAEALRGAHGLRQPIRQALDAALGYSARLRSIDLRLSGHAFSAVAIPLMLLALRTPAYSSHIGFSPAIYPVAACHVVEALPADARILAPDKYGGYLIYRFNGTRKVFFDGRSDFYGAGFIEQYLALIEVRPGWSETVRSFRFSHALLPSAAPLNGALRQAGWNTLYADDVSTLLEAP